jgi:hypothetical protein
MPGLELLREVKRNRTQRIGQEIDFLKYIWFYRFDFGAQPITHVLINQNYLEFKFLIKSKILN